MTSAGKSDQLILGYYVVAFIDLLGQQDRLRNLTAVPDTTNPSAMTETIEALKHTYGAITGMRKMFEDTFEHFGKTKLPNNNLNNEQKLVYQSLNNHPIKIQNFSDSTTVYLALRDTDEARLHVRGILGILAGAAAAMLGSLQAGHPLRGGIDLGVGFEPNEGEIYGPALARAYAMESKIADYPRIVIGDDLLEYINGCANNSQNDPVSRTTKNVATMCLDFIDHDYDGTPFLDFIGKGLPDEARREIYAAYLDRSYNFVLNSIEKCRKERNGKLAFRYTILKKYFDDRLPIWKDVPRAPLPDLDGFQKPG